MSDEIKRPGDFTPEVLAKMYKEYLKEFFCKPLEDSKAAILDSLVGANPKGLYDTYAWRISSKEEIRQVVQWFILAFEERVYWYSSNIYDIMNVSFSKNSMVQWMIEYPVLIIWHTGQQPAVKWSGDLLNHILSSREMKNRPTLVISQIESSLLPKLTDPWTGANIVYTPPTVTTPSTDGRGQMI